MPGECGKGEEATDLGSAGMKSACRVPRVGVGRRLRFLRQYLTRSTRAMRRARPPTEPMEPPTSEPMWEFLVGDEVEADPATLLVAELNGVLRLSSGVTVWVMTTVLGLLEPGVDRLLLEGIFVGAMLVEGV